MFKMNSVSFSKEQLDLINKIFDKDFEGVWTLREQDEGLDIDVFTMYQVTNTGKCIVLEKGEYKTSGYFFDCLTYIHHWI